MTGGPRSGTYTGRAALTPPGLPQDGGSLAALTGAERPTRSPVQAGPGLAGRALPTNQWWTSALTGPWTQPLWTFPVVARAGPDGLELSAPVPVASPDAVVQSSAPALLVGGPLTGVSVTDYGDFSVSLELARSPGALRTVLAQGSPVVPLAAPKGELAVELRGAERVSAGTRGDPLEPGATATTDRVRVRASGQEWDLTAERAVSWRRTPEGLLLTSPAPVRYAFAPVPEGAGADWQSRVVAAAAQPVTGTSSVLSVDQAAGVVHQVLTWQGAPTRIVALLAHQRSTLHPGGTAVVGRYRTSRGDLTLVDTAAVQLDVPLPPALPGIPEVPLGQEDAQRVAADLRSDLAVPDTTAAGSYFSPKALGRLATLLQVARRLDLPEQPELTARLRAGLVDWLTADRETGAHGLGYDPAWGGLVGLPSEFGNSDYNDHHFQFGYLIHAAATLAEKDPGFVRQFGAAVDLLVADIMGASSPSFPPFRVWNAWEGHSFAGGFASAADGNDQESSSEAVSAWAGISRWGLLPGRHAIGTAALARYAVEALAANTYWLGLGERLWPAEFAHDTAGIVWGGKVDFATFFDGRPEAVIGIQLLPFSYASLYRSGETATRRRSDVATAAGDGTPRLWPDLFLQDLAVVDPARALAGFTDETPVEAGSSRAFARYWLLSFARLGTPRGDVVADPPIGLALGGPPGGPPDTLAAVNPTADDLLVTWHLRGGRTVGSLHVPAGAAVTTGG